MRAVPVTPRQVMFTVCGHCPSLHAEGLNHTTTDYKEGEQLEDRRNVGEISCNFGDGTDQRVQSLILLLLLLLLLLFGWYRSAFL